MPQDVVFSSESDTQFFDTQDGGEKSAVRARDGSIITFSVCLVPCSSRILMVDFHLG